MLDLMKELLSMALVDTSKDTILSFYLLKSKQAIIKYKGIAYTDEAFELEFSNQSVELAIYYYKNRDNVGLSSVSQGGRSLSKESKLIPTAIMSTLGLPYVRGGLSVL